MMKKIPILFIFLCIFCANTDAQNIIRGPYLQKASSTSITVKWRTNTATQSIVEYGTSFGNYNLNEANSTLTTEHEIQIDNLNPETKYYYRISNNNGVLLPGTINIYFKTHPTVGTEKPFSFWVLGDCGTGNNNQRNVRDGFYNYIGSNHTDGILLLGDNAYNDGTDSEYQDAIFEDMYEDKLQNTILWSCLGNHDAHSADADSQTGDYFDIFSFPTAGESGGTPSGTEAYYSFDYGNIHFICLESSETDTDVGGVMYNWAKFDIENTTQKWIVAYWHHPAYTKGSHDSDTEGSLKNMRENFTPMLEENGVDLVLSGHSHSYERSYYLNGHTGLSNTFDPGLHTVGDTGDGDGRIGGDGAYCRPLNGEAIQDGAVYITAGSSGKATGNGALDHNAMYYADLALGSCVLEVDGNKMDVKFIRDTQDNGFDVDDYFTIEKKNIICTAGEPCDDGNPNTINDVLDVGCNCNGTLAYETLCVKVNKGQDDAEEASNGNVNITSSDLEMVQENSTQTIGLKFDNIDLPAGATVVEAYLQFTVDESDSRTTVLNIRGEQVGNAISFTTSNQNITSRATTTASVSWNVPAWNNINVSGPDQKSPNLAPILNEIITGSGFVTGNDIALIIDGTGKRVADSFNGSSVNAPELCITFSTSDCTTVGQPCDDGNPATLNDAYDINCNCIGIANPDVELCIKVESNNDDAEERSNGSMYLGSTDLEMVQESSIQTVGLKFNNINVPTGSIITSAYLQFTADETNSELTNLKISGEAVGNALTFTTTSQNITSRPTTSTSVMWNVPAWNVFGASGAAQKSPDISGILNEIITGPGFVSGNDIALIIDGVGKRVAFSYNGSASKAPELCLTYGGGGCTTVGQPCDDGDDNTINDVYDANCNCLGTVSSAMSCSRIDSGWDDVEENANGSIYSNSTDLELIRDNNNNQTIGLRFNNVDVPNGANITSAYIQFTSDEIDSENTSLTIAAEDVANASAFSSSNSNVSNRNTTTAAVNWNPNAWTTTNTAGPNQRTPNIASVVQEVVDLQGYAQNNSMVMIITGNGKRTADSFEGGASKAAELCITYSGSSRPAMTRDNSSNGKLAAEDNNPTILLYPNPAQQLLNIKMNHIVGNGEVEIFDNMGKQIFQKNLKNGIFEMGIDVNDFPQGFYYLKLRMENGLFLVEKFTKE